MNYPDEPGPLLYWHNVLEDWVPKTHGRYPHRAFTPATRHVRYRGPVRRFR